MRSDIIIIGVKSGKSLNLPENWEYNLDKLVIKGYGRLTKYFRVDRLSFNDD